MDNVTRDKLEKAFPGEGDKRWREICDRGGFGNVPPTYEGGLDIRGLLDPENVPSKESGIKPLSDADKAKIAELAGVTKEDRKRIDSGETTAGTPDRKIAGKEK